MTCLSYSVTFETKYKRIQFVIALNDNDPSERTVSLINIRSSLIKY